MKQHSWIAILDFGSQYSQLIARRIREQHVYSEIVHYSTPALILAERKPSGIVFSGGPSSVFEKGAPLCDPAIFDLKTPILGICYGLQMIAKMQGGTVKPGKTREYGSAEISILDGQPLFAENAQPLARFRRAERARTGAKRLKRGAEIPIAVLVSRVALRRRFDLRSAVRPALPGLASAIRQAMSQR
jgi:GMP synthase-like glutamine amidotransferase